MAEPARGEPPALPRRGLFANAVANFFGQAWNAVLGIAVVPVYLRLLGGEGYGLASFFASIQAVLAILDLGLSTTANRELARRGAGDPSGSRNLVRTLEIFYFGMAALVAILVALGSGLIASSWLKLEQLGPHEVRHLLILFGLSLAVRWPVALYSAVLRGLERQVLLNAGQGIAATLRHGGTVAVLALVSPTLYAMVLWQLIASAIELGLLWVMAWKSLPRDGIRARPDTSLLRGILPYAATMTLIAVAGTALKQMDKLIISAMLPMEQLGYYNTANLMGGAIGVLLVAPVFNVLFPRFSALAAAKEPSADLFHRASKVVALIAAPAAGVMIFFPQPLLEFWTRSPVAAEAAAPALRLFAIGALMNSMMHVPYAVQLAFGLQRIALVFNLVSIVVLAPLTYWAVGRWGIAGGALAWALLNTGYYLILPHITHRYVLQGHKSRWIFQDTLPHILAVLFVFGGAFLASRSFPGLLPEVAWAGAGLLVHAGFAAVYYRKALDSFPRFSCAAPPPQ